MKYAKTIAALSTAGAIGLFTYVFYESETDFHVWMYAGNTSHDNAIEDLIDSDVSQGNYCQTDTQALLAAAQGDVFISARADSYVCNYNSTRLLGIAVVGASNNTEDVGDEKILNAIYISNGRAYGGAVDFIYGGINLGDSMAMAANDIARVNSARLDAGMSILDTQGMKHVFNHASTDKVIDMDLAIEIATATTPPVACTICAALAGGANYLLLGD